MTSVMRMYGLNHVLLKVLGKEEVIDQGKEFVAEGQNMVHSRIVCVALILGCFLSLALLFTQELALATPCDCVCFSSITVMADEEVQRQGGDALWQSMQYALQVSYYSFPVQVITIILLWWHWVRIRSRVAM